MILNYTTKIEASKSVGEIQAILSKHGVRKMTIDYDEGGNPIALTFMVITERGIIHFALPCNYEGVKRVMYSGKKIDGKAATEQALRVSWRILKDWVEAQMAIVSAQLAAIHEVFLPYAITKDGLTLAEYINQDSRLLLTTNNK